jgi:hypothetical protein
MLAPGHRRRIFGPGPRAKDIRELQGNYLHYDVAVLTLSGPMYGEPWQGSDFVNGPWLKANPLLFKKSRWRPNQALTDDCRATRWRLQSTGDGPSGPHQPGPPALGPGLGPRIGAMTLVLTSSALKSCRSRLKRPSGARLAVNGREEMGASLRGCRSGRWLGQRAGLHCVASTVCP